MIIMFFNVLLMLMLEKEQKQKKKRRLPLLRQYLSPKRYVTLFFLAQKVLRNPCDDRTFE
jgi:hypothetical protein